MPNALITKMQEIVDYNKAAGILTKGDQAGERVRFFSKNGPKIDRISELGEGANQFIYSANRHYLSGIFKPPHTPQNVEQIYKLLDELNKDLQGSSTGTDAEQLRHQQWQAFWNLQLQDHPGLTANLLTVQQEILAAYRFKAINYCAFKPHVRSTQQDEIRIQDFLLEVSNRMRSGLSAINTYNDLSSNLVCSKDLEIIPRKPADPNIQQLPNHK